MLQLIRPDASMFLTWDEAHREWGPGVHEDGFGIDASDDVSSEVGFRTWVQAVLDGRTEAWWIVEDGSVVGGASLRRADDERVNVLGHLGYGVRPSARGRGVASWALRQMVAHAAQQGRDSLIAVCESDNVGSIATLERAGALLEATELHGSVVVRRYALPTSSTRHDPPSTAAAAAP